MSQHRKLLSTAADFPVEDESDYTVETAQDKLKWKIFLRKLLIYICVLSVVCVITAPIAMAVLYSADLFGNKSDHSSPTSTSPIISPTVSPSSDPSPSSAHVSTSFTISSTPSTSSIPTPTPSPTASPPSGMNNSKVLDYIDTSYDPCEDFYNYSCGGWHSTRPDAAEWGTFEELALDNYNKLAGYLSHYVRNSDPDAIKKAKYIYSACVDTYYIKENLFDQLDSFMDKAGGWENGDFSPYDYSWSINNNLYQDHYLGSSAFFGFEISPDDLNSSKPVIRVTCMCTTNYRFDLHILF